jgi:hypothetical protein
MNLSNKFDFLKRFVRITHTQIDSSLTSTLDKSEWLECISTNRWKAFERSVGLSRGTWMGGEKRCYRLSFK